MLVLKFISALVLINSCLSVYFDCDPCDCTIKDCFLMEADCTYKNTETQLDEIPGNFSQRIDEMDLSEQPLKMLKKYVFKNANLSDLQVLIIRGSQISDIHKNAFDNMTKLKHLDLSDNNITFIYKETMYWLKTLKSLDLSKNNIKYLPDLRNFTKLQELSLSENKICFLNQKLLENTTELVKLHLSHNNIETIANNTFERLTNLRHLHIANNSLTRLPNNIFQNNTKLRILILENNTLVGLPDNLLENLTQFTVLDVKFNKIRTIPHNLLHNKTNLLQIDLSNNEIEELPEAVFHNLSVLHILKVSHNNIKSLHSHQIATENCTVGSSFLQVFLDHNKINEIPSKFLGKTCSSISVYLSFNNISKVDPNAFSDAQLHHLDLSHNQLTVISKDTFKTDLIYLDLSYNKLTVLPDNIFNSAHLSVLNLNNNNLRMLSSKWFDVKMVLLLHLAAANNSITYFDITSNLCLTVDLLNNKLNCDCNLQTQFQQYQSKSSSVECYSPPQLEGKEWVQLTLDQLACEPKLLDNVTEMSADGTIKSIRCKAYGAPTPKIRWLKNNTTLPDNDTNIRQTFLTESKDVYWYNLTFSSNTTENFAGQYFCELSNAAGLAKLNFTVVPSQASHIHVGTALWITAVVLILIGVHVVLVMFYIKRLHKNAAATSTVSAVPYENIDIDEDENQAMV